MDTWFELPAPPDANRIVQMAGRGAIGEMVMDHIGIAVRDVEAAVDRFSTVLGLHDWTISTIESPVEIRCVSQVAGARIAMAALGPVKIELVQPTTGAWTPAEFLETRGEGIYHIGVRVPDVAAAIEGAAKTGMRVFTAGVTPAGPVWAYLESSDLHGVSLELVGPRVLAEIMKDITSRE